MKAPRSSSRTRLGVEVAGIGLAMLLAISPAAAQIALPIKTYETLDVQIESLRDDITLFHGDPQNLLLMEIRPNRFRPRVEYFDRTDANLRIRDLYAVDHPDFASQPPESRDKGGDPPLAETWEIRLSPVGPTSFSLLCERGKAELDLSDMEVQSVSMRATETQVDVEFTDPNPIVLDRFAARVIAGSLRFDHVLNARAKEISLDVPDTVCELSIVGKEFEGESGINILGTPAEVRLLVSRKVGLRVTGPAATIARFQGSHMSPSGSDWVSEGYDQAKCRTHLTFGSEVAKLHVEWD